MQRKREVFQIGTDGSSHRLTEQEIVEMDKKAARSRAKRVKAKGHDCDEHLVHETYVRDNGGVGDAYYCGICGDLIQVG